MEKPGLDCASSCAAGRCRGRAFAHSAIVAMTCSAVKRFAGIRAASNVVHQCLNFDILNSDWFFTNIIFWYFLNFLNSLFSGTSVSYATVRALAFQKRTLASNCVAAELASVLLASKQTNCRWSEKETWAASLHLRSPFLCQRGACNFFAFFLQCPLASPDISLAILLVVTGSMRPGPVDGKM